jgi:RimJ/RimL family protein N-acetyltransferase
MADIPTLETARLILRGPSSTDFDDLCAMFGDPEVVKHVGGVTLTSEDVWVRILRYLGHWQLFGYGTWIVRDKAGAFVGEVGMFDYRRVITPALEIPEVGWGLARAQQGKGYATEALRAVLAWGDQHFGARPMSAIIDVGNAPSLRLAERCGFREVGRATYKDAPVIVLRREPS